MSTWMYVAGYLAIAAIVAGFFVDDVNDIDDVGKSSLAGICWPTVVLILGFLYMVAGVAKLRKSWRSK